MPAGLAALAIPFRINPRLVRGLDYYGPIAFEITSTQLGAQATLCGSAFSKQFKMAYKSVARWAAGDWRQRSGRGGQDERALA